MKIYIVRYLTYCGKLIEKTVHAFDQGHALRKIVNCKEVYSISQQS